MAHAPTASDVADGQGFSRLQSAVVPADDPPMRPVLPRRGVVAALLLPLLATACGEDRDLAPARAAFVAFEQALRAGDESACRGLMTRDSAVALAEIPWAQVQAKQPLVVLGARRVGSEFRVDVRDPNAGNAAGEYIVVREYGRMVVDLIATAALTAEVRENPNSADVLEPWPLTPEELDRIRLHELATPPK